MSGRCVLICSFTLVTTSHSNCDVSNLYNSQCCSVLTLRLLIIYILVINVTAACVRGCTASVGLLVTGKRKENGDTENYKGDGGGGGELVSYISG